MSARQYFDTLFPSETAYVQLLGYSLTNGLTLERAKFFQDRDKLVEAVDQWTKDKLSAYVTMAEFASFDPDNRFKRSAHEIAHPRDYVMFDFDLKDQNEHFKDLQTIYNAVSGLWGKALIAVLSGGGIHLYYRYSGDVIAAQKAAVRYFADPDSATLPVIDRRAGQAATDIIRVPGGYNYKRGKQVIAHFGPDVPNPLKGLDAVPVRHSSHKRLKIAGDIPAALHHYDCMASFPDPLVATDAVYRGCAVMRQIRDDAQYGFMRDDKQLMSHEDMLTVMSVYKFSAITDKATEDTQLAAACELLHAYPQSNRKWLTSQYESVRFPRGCDTFSLHYTTSHCETCDFRNNFTKDTKPTPIGAGFAAPENTQLDSEDPEPDPEPEPEQAHTPTPIAATPAAPQDSFVPVPNRFKVTSAGVFKEGETAKLLCKTPFRIRRGHVIIDQATIFTIGTEADDVSHNIVLRSQANSQLDGLAKVGIIPASTNASVRNDLTHYIHQSYQQTVAVPDQLGWGNVHGRRVFGFPEATYEENKGIISIKPPPILASTTDYARLSRDENAAVWWDACEELYFTYPLMARHAEMVLASFASPLYHLLAKDNVKGHSLLLYGEPNSGKSQALKTAHQVWGDGDKTNTKSDTIVYVYSMMGIRRNMPVTFDDCMREGHTMESNDVAGLFHMVPEGKSRGRGRQDGSAADIHTFSCMLLGTSNASAMALISQNSTMDTGKAATDRLTEHYVKDLKPMFDKKEIDIIEVSIRCGEVIQAHAGSPGREFIRQFMANYDVYRTFADGYHAKLRRLNRHEAIYATMLATAHRVLQDLGRLKLSSEFLNELGIGYRASKQRIDIAQDAKRAEILKSIPDPTTLLAYYSKHFQDVDWDPTNNELVIAPDRAGAIRTHETSIWVLKNAHAVIPNARPRQIAYVFRRGIIDHYCRQRSVAVRTEEITGHWLSTKLASEHTLTLPFATSGVARITESCLVYLQ